MQPYTQKLTRTCLVSALALSCGYTGALAQDGSDATGVETERRYGPVVVTAQRREESQLDVPLSVSAFDGDVLAELGVTDLTEVGKISPNVTLEVARGSNTTLTAFIRGVGQQDPVAGFEPGVGIYLDDVYLNRPQGAVLDVFDVERIEVLRGPQGTLYGRNTIGGAVKYVTRRLSDDPSLSLRAAAGSYGQTDLIASGSVPLADILRVGGAVAYLHHDGYGDNLTLPGVENYNKNVFAARGSAELDVTPDFQLRFSGDYTKDTSDPKQGHRLIPSLFSGAPVLKDVFDTRAGLNVVDQRLEAYGLSLVGEWTLNEYFTVKNIISHRQDESTSPIDFDSLPTDDLDVPVRYVNAQTSEEFQVLYSGDRLNGIVGVYYLDANAKNVFDVVLGPLGTLIGLPGLNAQTFGKVGTETWSVFGDFTFDIAPEWSVALGGRYTEDKRTSFVFRRTFIGGFSDAFGGTGIPIATTSNFNGEDTFTDFSPRVSVSWKPDDDNNIYATFSQGFKGGGFDPRALTTAAPDLDSNGVVSAQEIFDFMQFKPEQVDSYELGWKTNAFDGRVQSSVAAFYSDYKDVQVPGSVGVDTDNDGINDSFTGVTTNAGAATIWGIEFEGLAVLGENTIRADDSFNFGWSVGYLDAQFDEFIDATGTDVADQRVIQNTPDWTASGRLIYDTPLSLGGHDGRLSMNTLVSYRGDSSQFEIPGAIDQNAFALVDAAIRWETASGRWGFSINGKNLTDKEYKVAGYNFVTPAGVPTLGLEGTLTAFYGPPRTVTFGVDFKY